MTPPRSWPWAAHVSGLSVGTRVIVSTSRPGRRRPLVLTKVGDNAWASARSPEADPQTDAQVGWWLEHRPEKTRIDDTDAGFQPEPVEL